MNRGKDEGGRAFPSEGEFRSDDRSFGLTRREWFAGKALAGILANPELTKRWRDGELVPQAVLLAFEIADGCLPADPD
jgi:hypothetical protein